MDHFSAPGFAPENQVPASEFGVLYEEFLNELGKLLSFSVHADWGFLVFFEGAAQAGAKRAVDEYNVNLFVPGVNVGIHIHFFVYGERPVSPENWKEYGDARTLG